MSNLSLKEQLEALSLSTPASAKEKSKKPAYRKPASTTVKPTGAKPKPAWLEYAQYGVELLKAHYPACFKEAKEVQPLKVGIKQDLVKALGSREDIVISDKACMVTSLAYYVNSVSYHKTMAENAARIDLEGNPAGQVSEEEAKYSIECRQAKHQKKQPTESDQ